MRFVCVEIVPAHQLSKNFAEENLCVIGTGVSKRRITIWTYTEIVRGF